MLAERPLEGENTDPWADGSYADKCRSGLCIRALAQQGPYQPRTSSRSDSSSVLEEMPTIGSPSPVETSARIFGSA